MNRSPKRFSFLQAALLGGAVVATATASLSGPSLVQAALQESPKAVLDEAWQIVNREYVDGTFNRTDWQATRQSLLGKTYANREQAYTALRAALEKLNDPYTRFMNPKQFESLSNQTSGELSGVGIRLEVNEQTKILTVVEPIENSPALKAGIKTGDRILAINGKDTKGMSVEDASNLIRGDVGTKVSLKVGRDGKTLVMPITRARIELATVRYSLKQEGARRIGYIRLNEFSSHAAEQMKRAIQDLSSKQVDGYVLDLRGNPGGLLQSSIEISRMWMDKGLIVRTVDRKGNSEEIANNRTALTKLPLVVLVDGNSASSSEILTGALKDNGRATIVGSQTFGKAMVQSVHSLSDGSGLAVTIAQYYSPSGIDISHKGIAPDIKVDLTDNDKQRLSADPKLIATKNDPQYASALMVLEKLTIAKPVTPPGQQASKN
ncbi:MAG TPA: carboxyl-terminal processing protease CtpB [Thermosynechococcaceae cyanobacterium]